jgi:hypothetical protein
MNVADLSDLKAGQSLTHVGPAGRQTVTFESVGGMTKRRRWVVLAYVKTETGLTMAVTASELRKRVTAKSADKFGNVLAREGYDFCVCGAKYWENDICQSCGASFDPATRTNEN